MEAKRKGRSGMRFGLILAACMAISALAVAYPIYVIRPFRTQGPQELFVALVVMQWRGVATVISALAAFAALVVFWRVPSRWWRRGLALVGALGVAALAVAARINVYELMFHPAGGPAFSPAAEVRLDGDEKVIAVQVGSAARAYPVRIISYHHVINDVVDGKGIVATY